MKRLALAAAAAIAPLAARAAEMPPAAAPAAPPTDTTAIIMFAGFVLLTLAITAWAARRTRTASDFYAAGGSITGFQNGVAISGDFMSAASFLGISAMVYAAGFDGLLYSIGFLVGWPIIMFLMAEHLRNLGKYSMADVTAYRLSAVPVRSLSAVSSLVVVAFYLIAQMVGAGQLIQLLFGLQYSTAVLIVGVLMILYVTFGGMIATTWVQIIKAIPASSRRHLHRFRCTRAFWLQPERDVRCRRAGQPKKSRDPLARPAVQEPDLDYLARGGADVRHRRLAAHPDALLHRVGREGSAQIGVLGHQLHRLFLHPDLHHRLCRNQHGRPERRV